MNIFDYFDSNSKKFTWLTHDALNPQPIPERIRQTGAKFFARVQPQIICERQRRWRTLVFVRKNFRDF